MIKPILRYLFGFTGKEPLKVRTFSIDHFMVTTLECAPQKFKCRCPFHAEKTPSFVINESTLSYRCFGCGKAGEVREVVNG